MKKILSILVLCLMFVFSANAQLTCANAQPFCAGGTSGGTFPASTNAVDAEAGPDYGCLGTQPNPAWYYLQISQSGNLDILIQGNANQDVDFICWGPFSSLAGICNSLTAAYIVDCSYSSSPTETCNIVGAVAGQFYMVLITNFSNVAQDILFTQTAGTGSTNCGIVSTNTMICAGSVASLSITNNSGLANPSYSINPGAQTSPTPVFTVSPSNTTTYTLYVTGTNTINNTLITQTAVATVTILPRPVVSPNMVNSTCSNATNSVNLNVSFIPSGSPNYTVIWAPPPSNFSPVNSGTASGLTPGTQNVTVTTGSCSVTASFVVGPIQVPASFTVFNLANDYTVTCINPNVVLTTSITNGNPLTYTWMPGCTPSVTGSSITFTQPCTGQVVGSSSTGCTMTRTFQVFSNFQSPTIAVTPTVNTINCAGGNGCFTLTSNLGPNVTTNWFQVIGTSTSYVGAAQGTINIFCAGSPGVYWAESVYNITGCRSTKSVQVTASVGVPQFTLTSPTNFTIGCASKSITSMQVTSVITTPVASVPVKFVFMTPPVTGTPPASAFQNNPNLNNITIPGTYVVYVRDESNLCVSSQSISIIQNTIAPNVDYIQPLSILTCKDPSMVLNGISSNPNTNITWTVPAIPSNSVNPTPNATVIINPAIANSGASITVIGTWTVGAVDNNNFCASTKTTQILQDIRIPSFSISALTNGSITCKNPDVVIVPITSAQTASLLIPTYVWYPPVGPPVAGSQFNSTSPGSHTAICTSVINGCTTQATYIVAIDVTPPALSATTPFTLDCSANPIVTIYPIITPTSGAYTYSWTAPAGVLISNPQGMNLTANQIGLYKVAVTNTVNGCQSSESYSVINGALTANFVPSTTFGYAPLTVFFTNTSATSTGASSIQCLWSYGNGAVSSAVFNTVTPATTYTAPGTYSVILITKKGSCVDSALKIIIVEIPSKMQIPNVFTPNGDKVNDHFRLIASSLKEINVMIFDRWGNKVYEVISETGNFAWDGKNQFGKECASGTYFYIIKAQGKDGQEFDQKGNVSLYR
jgi:gliding motility-associated-like protein